MRCTAAFFCDLSQGAARDRLVVEEDVRQRVRVHWRSADDGT